MFIHIERATEVPITAAKVMVSGSEGLQGAGSSSRMRPKLKRSAPTIVNPYGVVKETLCH